MNKAAKVFDVTLRDGLQTSKKILNLSEKKAMLNNIMNTYNPTYIEVGSLVSPKVLPQMKHSLELYKYASSQYIYNHFFLLVPNINYLKKGFEKGVDNYSFITSVSKDFQMKNIKKDLQDTKQELNDMMNYLDKNHHTGMRKLYISCINECPIFGKIDNHSVIEEILYYKDNFHFDNICLSDTCGTLSYKDMKEIIEYLLEFNMKPEKLSIHLHLHNDDRAKIQSMLNFLIINNIRLFDVSMLEDAGGCSVTINEGKTKRNLTYQDLIEWYLC